MANATINSIAKETKLSTATVSRVLSGSNYPVKEETRKIILEAAKSAGYVPNMLARSLKTKVSNEIAVIIPLIKNPFYTAFAGGIEGELSKTDFTMSLYTTEYNDSHADSLLSKLASRAVAGVIIASDSMTLDLYNALCKLNQATQVPIITMGHKSDYNHFPGIFCDYVSGMKMAVEYLFDKGHRDIAFAFSSMNRETSKAKWVGAQAAYNARGYTASDYFMKAANNDSISGTLLAEVIMQSEIKYTAIAAGNDILATGLLLGLAELKIRVPEDISVMGFNDSLYARVCYPALTTIRMPSWAIGVQAVKMLFDMLQNREMPESVFLEPQVIERASIREIGV